MGKFSDKGKAKAQAKKDAREKSSTGPKEAPSSVQLPGGVTIRAFPFRITSVDGAGRPLTFERARGNEDSDCVLWGTDEFLDGKLRADLDLRMRRRIEESIEGPGSYSRQGRDIQMVHASPDVHAALKEKLASVGHDPAYTRDVKAVDE